MERFAVSSPLGGSHASARFPQPKRTFRGLGFLVVLGHGVFPGGAYVMGGRVGVRSTYVRVELDPTLTILLIYIYPSLPYPSCPPRWPYPLNKQLLPYVPANIQYFLLFGSP